jgi:hypothetical protein
VGGSLFCDTCGNPSGKLKYCSKECRPSSSEYREQIRAEFRAAYGGKCQCCGETEPKFLELDHSDNSGAMHRKVTGTHGYSMYRLLRDQGWPKGQYRLLCSNCNMCRSRYGRCPHEERRELRENKLD